MDAAATGAGSLRLQKGWSGCAATEGTLRCQRNRSPDTRSLKCDQRPRPPPQRLPLRRTAALQCRMRRPERAVCERKLSCADAMRARTRRARSSGTGEDPAVAMRQVRPARCRPMWIHWLPVTGAPCMPPSHALRTRASEHVGYVAACKDRSVPTASRSHGCDRCDSMRVDGNNCLCCKACARACVLIELVDSSGRASYHGWRRC